MDNGHCQVVIGLGDPGPPQLPSAVSLVAGYQGEAIFYESLGQQTVGFFVSRIKTVIDFQIVHIKLKRPVPLPVVTQNQVAIVVYLEQYRGKVTGIELMY